jgi:diguanylate cyclase
MEDSTLQIAEVAVQKLYDSELPLTPELYEVFYAYAVGDNSSLVQTVDHALARRDDSQTLKRELLEIKAQFISPNDVESRIGDLGWLLDEKIDNTSAALGAAINFTGTCVQDFGRAVDMIRVIRRREELTAALSELTRAIDKMKATETELRARLGGSHDEIRELRRNLDLLCRESQNDPVTRLTGRKMFESLLARTADRSGRDLPSLSLVVCGVDDFKTFNRFFGHSLGDKILRLIAGVLQSAFGEQGIVARLGGDVFAAALPSMGVEQARGLAEDCRRMLSSRDILDRSTGRNLGRVTMSFGVTHMGERDTIKSLLGRGKAYLDEAKKTGRNRVVCEADVNARHGEMRPRH